MCATPCISPTSWEKRFTAVTLKRRMDLQQRSFLTTASALDAGECPCTLCPAPAIHLLSNA